MQQRGINATRKWMVSAHGKGRLKPQPDMQTGSYITSVVTRGYIALFTTTMTLTHNV